MSFEPQHVAVEIIWQDPDVVEILASASNHDFAARTRVYTVYEELSSLAESLRDFPKAVSDEAYFSAGTVGGYSFWSCRFYCVDRVGHSAVQVHTEANVPTECRAEEKHTAVLEIQVGPAAIQSFASQLTKVVSEKSGRAELLGNGPDTRIVGPTT